MRLAGRRILITGGASGIGRATAELFAKEGAKIAVMDRQFTMAEDVARAIKGVAVEADVADEESTNSAVAKAVKALGGLDGLVHCAGIVDSQKFTDSDFKTWRRTMSINLDGTYLVCRAALPFLQQADKATIVTIASGQALMPGASSISYGASKAGVMNFTKALAMELAPKIRANVVCPGATETPMVAGMLQAGGAAVVEGLKNAYAMKRMAQPQEIAAALLFLTSHESSFVTGVALAVDGGRTYH